MKLISCHIDAFGKFKNIGFNFYENMNVFCEKNGFGKTTLAQFIKAMFYSLPANSKKINFKSERDLYRPLDFDGKFGGRLTFSCKRGNYTVVRQFGNTPTLDKFFLFDAKTNLISNDFSGSLGDELFGVGRETFENSTFFGQQNLISGINDDMRASLSTGVLSGDDLDNFEKSQGLIQKRLKEIRANNKILKLDETKADFERAKAKEEILKIKLSNVETEIYQLTLVSQETSNSQKFVSGKESTKEVSNLINRNVALESVIEADKEKIGEKNKQKENLLQNTKIDNEIYKFLKDNNKINRGHHAGTWTYFLIVFAMLGVACIACGGNFGINYLYIFGSALALTSLGGLIFCVIISRNCAEDIKKYNDILHRLNLNSKSLEQELSAFEKISGDISFIDNEILKLSQGVEKNIFEMKSLQKRFKMNYGCEIQEFYLEMDAKSQKISNVDRKLIELKTDRRHFLEEMELLQEKLFELSDALEYKNVSMFENDKKINVLTKASAILEKSRDAISNRFIEPVSYRFNKYYKKFINDGEEIVIDSNLGMRFGAQFNEVDFLSAGLLDLVYICKRFALADLLFKKEKPSFILDDPFANFDDEKLDIARSLLNELKRDYQIVLFTCQKSRS